VNPPWIKYLSGSASHSMMKWLRTSASPSIGRVFLGLQIIDTNIFDLLSQKEKGTRLKNQRN
jgi:hypothetical protein